MKSAKRPPAAHFWQLHLPNTSYQLYLVAVRPYSFILAQLMKRANVDGWAAREC